MQTLYTYTAKSRRFSDNQKIIENSESAITDDYD